MHRLVSTSRGRVFHPTALSALVLFTTVLCTGSALAAPQTVPSQPFTEAEFLAVLDDRHPASLERAESLGLARARAIATATLDNPEFSFAREDPSGPTETTDWALAWQLPSASRRLEIAASREVVAAAKARFDLDRATLRFRMKEIYADWAIASSRAQRLQSQLRRIHALAERESARAAAGESSGLEARRLALAASDLQVQVALATTRAEKARAMARVWHPGLADGSEPALPQVPSSPPGNDGDHPMLRAAQADLEAADLERQAAGRFLASPELQAGWHREKTAGLSVDGPVVGLAWSIPLFDRKQAAQATAEVRILSASARLELARRELDAIRSAAASTFRRLAAAVATATAALNGNERMLAGAEEGFRLGETTLTDLLATLGSAKESEMGVLDLHQAALAAHRELERLVSTESTPSDSFHSTTEENLP